MPSFTQRIRISFFRGVGIPAPVDEFPLLTTAELYLRPGRQILNPGRHVKNRKTAAADHIRFGNLAAPAKRR